MRVLFIYPNIDCPAGINHGLAMMSGVLKAAGHETKLIHVNEGLWDVPSHHEIIEEVREFDPGIIGYSVMSQQYDWTCEVSKAIRKAMPDVPQVIGGVHCTMVPDEVTRDGVFDYVGVGECDFAFKELCERLETGRDDPKTTPNFRYLDAEGNIAKNDMMPFPDLDEMPPKDYDLFDLKRILGGKNGWLGILTSRGCPYKCTYCFNKEIVDLYLEEGGAKNAKEYLRHYSVERILDEIRDLKTRFPAVNTVIFDDDLFTLDRKYVHEFSEKYKASELDLPFVVNAHVSVFDEDMAGSLAEAGCTIVKYGLESGSDRVRKEVLWRFTPDFKIERALAAAHKFDMHTSTFIMIGLPTETREELYETIKVCARVQMGRFRWAVFFPFPGTAGFRISEEKGLIDHDRMGSLGNYFDGSCLKFDAEQDLFLEKLSRVFHWYVNAETDWESAPIYRELCEKVETMSREDWTKYKREVKQIDRDLSEELLAKDITHYSLRYTHVMGVHSDFVKKDRAQQANKDWVVPAGYTLD